MAFRRTTIYTFQTKTSTGINEVPIDAVIYLTENDSGYTLENITGLTETTTVEEAIQNENLTLISSRDDIGVWKHSNGYFAKDSDKPFHIEIKNEDNKESNLTLKFSIMVKIAANVFSERVYQLTTIIPEPDTSNYSKEFNIRGYNLQDGADTTRNILIFTDSDNNKIKLKFLDSTEGNTYFSVDYLRFNNHQSIDPAQNGWTTI
jgi:hypothetical protein